ncbi:MAG TPA: DUF5665 domain-containing protein [Roseovarius sp.]|nr:DUF5665 domain-containing protein [Roseovarius sp.]HMB13677.1 DUF5665 domain-containing protein [Roseovarius sp.]
MKDDPTPESREDLTEEVRALRAELQTLNKHRFVRIHNNIPRLLAFNFARGLAVGLGTVLGATVLLSLIVWALSQIEFLPIIGEWASQIAEQMRSAQE